MRRWTAALGVVVVLLTVVSLAADADVGLAARITGATAGAVIAVLWAFWRAGDTPMAVQFAVIALVGTMSTTFAAPLAIVPVAIPAAVLIGWDSRSDMMAAVMGGGLSVAVLAGAVTDLPPPGLLSGLVLLPLISLGSNLLRRWLDSVSCQRDLAQMLSRAGTRMVGLGDSQSIYSEVLLAAQMVVDHGPVRVLTVVLLDRDLRRVVASRDDGGAPPVGRRLDDAPAALSDAYDAPSIATLGGADAASVFGQLGMARPPGTVLLAPLTKGEDRMGMLVIEVDRRPDEEVVHALGALADMAGVAIAEAECTDELAICDTRFRSLVEASADVIAVLSATGSMRYLSPSLEANFGYSPQAVTGQPLWRLMHPDDAHLLSEYLARAAIHDKVDDSVLLRLRDHIGRWRWVEMRARRLHAGCGVTCSLHGDAGVEVIANLRDVTDREELRRELEHQALHDHLTALPNRTLLRDRITLALAAADRAGVPIAMLYLDLDDFKAVNDSLGHTAGDKLLIDFADRLSHCVRPGDTTARLGGDEFAILLPQMESESSARDVAERVRDCLHDPFRMDELEVRMRVSIGLALSEPDDTADDLLRRADVAMYLAKHQGGDRIRTHHPETHDTRTARLRHTAELQRAVEHHEMVVHYQPIIDLTDDGVAGFEALVRWERPGRGLVGPGDFIPLAESAGLIREMDLVTLRAACEHLRRWQMIADGVGGAPLSMNVNLSGLTVMQPRVIGEIAKILDETGVHPRDVVLEVTEGVLLHGAEGAMHQLRALKDLGVRLAIDDFGVGYSSLAHLQQFPVDVLKIDRSFVATVDGATRDGTVARSIVELAHDLGLSMIAEGIERPTQADALRQLACPLGQGFHYARPMPPVAIEAALRSHA